MTLKQWDEDMVAGRLRPERFDKLSTQYEEEQKQFQEDWTTKWEGETPPTKKTRKQNHRKSFPEKL